MGVFMAEVYMYIYNWQEKKEENQALEDFCHAPVVRGGSIFISQSDCFCL
jgi:hypothetical protein